MDKDKPTKDSTGNSYYGESDSLESLDSLDPIVDSKVVPEPSKTPKPPYKIPMGISKRALIIAGTATSAIVIGGLIFVLTRPHDPKAPTQAPGTQTISSETLKKVLVNGGSSDNLQQITISPKVLFLNDVTVQGNVGLKGKLDVQGATTFHSQVTVNSPLSVTGAANFGGNISVSGTITTGGLNVGSLTVANVTIGNNLTVGGHIVPGGAKPKAVPSVAAGGGSVTISGNDTAGTITINVGGGPITGELAIISFKTAFGTTPKVQLTPINSSAAQLQYYATRSGDFFTIATASTPVAGTSYTFDYLVTQ